MAQKTVKLSVVNIALSQPHNHERYFQLWQTAFRAKRPIKVHGHTCAMIGTIDLDETKSYIFGHLFKFTEIEVDGAWLDLITGKKADDNIVSEQVSIPDRLRPNLQEFPYVFDLDTHRLVFINKLDSRANLYPYMVKKMLERLFMSVPVFGQPDITIEPEHESLQKIFSMPRLKKLEITITPPNALDDTERRILGLLDNRNLSRYEEIQTSKDSRGVIVDEDTKAKANVAKSNGLVKATGKDENGKTVNYSTEDHPFEDIKRYNPKVSSALLLIKSSFQDILRKILKHDKT